MSRIYVHGKSTNPAEADAVVCAKDHYDYALFAYHAPHRVFSTPKEAETALLLRKVDMMCGSASAGPRDTASGVQKATALLEKRKTQLLQYARKNHIPLTPPGHIILSPPGTGKTTYVKGQSKYCDLDDIAHEFNLHGEGYSQKPHTEEEERRHYTRIDGWLATLKELGFNVVGSLYENYVPDAIVILDVETHKQYVKKREDVTWERAAELRAMLQTFARKNNVKVFPTIQAAIASVS